MVVSKGKLLAGAALLAALAFGAGALAQTTGLFPTSFTGNETWSVALNGPGSQSEYVTSAMVRNTQGVTTNALTGAITLGNLQADLIITAQPASGANISLPPSPFDGQIVEVVNGTASAFATNVFSIIANSNGANATLVGGSIALTTLAAGASKELRYVLSTNSWYPLR